jgi:hypothetical protein
VNTKLLLSASAVVLGLLGVAGSFAPHEMLAAMGIAPTGVLPVLVQLTGALFFAFALVNGTSRGSRMGGIYNRPVALGNFAHFTIGALALMKSVAGGQRPPVVIALAFVYIAFALGFGLALFRPPAKN